MIPRVTFVESIKASSIHNTQLYKQDYIFFCRLFILYFNSPILLTSYEKIKKKRDPIFRAEHFYIEGVVGPRV